MLYSCFNIYSDLILDAGNMEIVAKCVTVLKMNRIMRGS